MGYISASGRDALLQYKYKATDDSILAPYFQPFWNRAVRWLPNWMAPNLVTLLGFLAIVFHFVLVVGYCPQLVGPIPNWVFLVCAACVFWYQTLDAIDGKQARLTNSSSALGELFDHGCDAMGATFNTIVIAATLQLGNSWWSLLTVGAVQLGFFCSVLEEFFTDIMHFGKFNSPTEALLAAIGIHLTTFALGTEFWTWDVLAMLGVPAAISDSLPIRLTVSRIMIGAIAFPAFQLCIQNVICAFKSQRIKQDGPLDLLLFSIPGLFLFGGFTLWMFISPEQLLQNHTIVALCILGLSNGYVVSRIIVQRTCHEPFQTFYSILVPLPFVIGNAISAKFNGGAPFVSETYLANLYLLYIVVLYSHYILTVIGEICDTLNIRCLHIATDVDVKKAK